MAKRGRKKPAQKAIPSSQRVPRGIKRAEKTKDELLVWNIGSMDTGGPWSWHGIDPNTWWEYLCPAMRDFSRMKWSEITGRLHHPVRVEHLVKEAQGRLIEIGREDTDMLFSLALSGKRRIWGIKDREVFRILWWDPSHEVYPVPKKHT